MADENQIGLDILVNIAGAVQALQSFRAQAGDALEGVSESVEGIGKSFESLQAVGEAALAIFAVDKIKEYFGESINLAAEEEQAMTRLASALGSTGEYSKDALADMQEFAEQMEDTTKYSNDLIISSLSVAKTFGITNDQAQELVTTSADLAAATGISLNDAVEKLGKTYSGHLGRLAQTFPIMNDLTTAQLQNGDAVKLLADRYEGAADHEVATFQGAMTQSQNAVDSFRKALGSVVTDSPTVLARIQGLTDFWHTLRDAVVNNKDSLIDFVNFGVEALATAIPVAVDILRVMATAFQIIVGTSELVVAGLLEIVDFLATAWRDTWGNAVDVFLGFISSIASVTEGIPGASTALKAMGFDSDALSLKIDSLHAGFDNIADGAVDSVDKVRDGMTEFAVTTDEKFTAFDKSFQAFSDSVDASAQKIFDADGKIIKSADDVKNSNGKRLPASTDLDDLLANFQEFVDDINAPAQDALAKAAELYKSQLDQLDTYVRDGLKKGVDFTEEAEEARLNLGEQFSDKRIAILQKEYDQNEALIRKTVGTAASNPIAFAVKDFTVDDDAIKELRDSISEDLDTGIALGAGLLDKAFKGKSGATELFTQLGGSIADAIIPGLGPVVSGLLGVLAQGPQQTKLFIEQFIQAIPDIVEAIAEAAPEIVDGFVDAMVNKGGAIKIALALAEAFSGAGSLQQIGKDWGVNFGTSLNSGDISRTVHGWFQSAIDEMGQIAPKIGSALTNAFQSFFGGIQPAADKIRAGFLEAPADIVQGFQNGVAYLESEGTKFFNGFGDAIAGAASRFGSNFLAPLTSAFSNFGSSIAASIKNAVLPDFHFPPLPNLEIPTPGWLKDFENAINSLNPAGGGGSGNGELNKILGFHAEGLTEVPAGYPNDTYYAGLTTGERVVSATQNDSLGQFLDDYNSGKSNAPMMALLAKLIGVVSQPQTVTSTAKVDNRAFASIALQLNRTNARVTA